MEKYIYPTKDGRWKFQFNVRLSTKRTGVAEWFKTEQDAIAYRDEFFKLNDLDYILKAPIGRKKFKWQEPLDEIKYPDLKCFHFTGGRTKGSKQGESDYITFNKQCQRWVFCFGKANIASSFSTEQAAIDARNKFFELNQMPELWNWSIDQRRDWFSKHKNKLYTVPPACENLCKKERVKHRNKNCELESAIKQVSEQLSLFDENPKPQVTEEKKKFLKKVRESSKCIYVPKDYQIADKQLFLMYVYDEKGNFKRFQPMSAEQATTFLNNYTAKNESYKFFRVTMIQPVEPVETKTYVLK